MSRDNIDDDVLMAYADGELDPSEATRVETALRDNPELKQRLALFAGTRDALVSAASLRRSEAVPEEVMARAQAAIDAARAKPAASDLAGAEALRTGVVVPFRHVLRQRAVEFLAIAASLAVVGFLGGYAMAPNAPGTQASDLRFAVLETPGLSQALSSLPAGVRSPLEDGEISVIASFRDAQDTLCREFEVDAADRTTIVSVACWTEGQWSPKLAVVAGASDATGYAPASSLDTLDAFLAGIEAGPPLDTDAEAEALRGLGR